MTRHLIVIVAGFVGIASLVACSRTAGPADRANGDPAAGAALFATNCATCHGERGRGDGPASPALEPKPKDLTDPAFQQATPDDKLVVVIEKGGRAAGLSDQMPAFGPTLDRRKIQDLVAFIRTLKR